MTSFIFKLTSAIVALSCAIQAVPLGRGCIGSACHQAVDSGHVSLGSTTNIVPVTEVTPITRYQPIIQSYAPIVEAETQCSENVPLDSMLESSYVRPSLMSLGRGPADEMMFGGGSGYRRMRPLTSGGTVNRFAKRDHLSSEVCVPSATQSCEQTIPSGTTDMGSFVTARPANTVLPSTVYHEHVQSKGPEVNAAAAEHKQLSQSNVNLGSDTMIQPVTKVFPETTYQPSVEQKATTIEASAPEDQSLDRSSVSLGSSVTVRPTTTVEPLTIYQPKIKSLPFIIHDEGCAPVIYDIPKYQYKPACPSF
ncbi:hypothetical protein BGX28_003468 [Mortierella sp. GBA30]|nr:hypothetical protein BGX28_003468 [Mortierella sp. GBA30]